jgi:hypothetical protein
VTAVANVGEQRPNQDSKVFEVKISVDRADTTLRPGMTTANAIETASIPAVLSIPLEAVVSDSGLSYVYKRDGGSIVRQQIDVGIMNDNEIVVRRGLAKGDEVLLVPPADRASIETNRLPGVKPVHPTGAGADTPRSVTIPATRAPDAPKR